MKRFRFYGVLPNGTRGLVFALSLETAEDAIRIMEQHPECVFSFEET